MLCCFTQWLNIFLTIFQYLIARSHTTLSWNSSLGAVSFQTIQADGNASFAVMKSSAVFAMVYFKLFQRTLMITLWWVLFGLLDKIILHEDLSFLSKFFPCLTKRCFFQYSFQTWNLISINIAFIWYLTAVFLYLDSIFWPRKTVSTTIMFSKVDSTLASIKLCYQLAHKQYLFQFEKLYKDSGTFSSFSERHILI